MKNILVIIGIDQYHVPPVAAKDQRTDSLIKAPIQRGVNHEAHI